MVTDGCAMAPPAFDRARAHGTTQAARPDKLQQLPLNLGQGITAPTDIAQKSAL